MKYRSTELELMDQADCSVPLLLRTVDQFSTINGLISRFRTILRRLVLDDMELNPDREFHMVDLGAGGCDIMIWLLKESRRRGLRLRVTAVDIDLRIIRHVQGRSGAVPGLTIRQADAFNIGEMGPVDYVFANHFLHHLSDDRIVELLQRLQETVQRRYVLSDLARSAYSYAGYYLLSNLFFRRSFAISDGLQSIRRGFLAGELWSFADAAGIASTASVWRLLPGRLVLYGGGADGGRRIFYHGDHGGHGERGFLP